MNPPCNPNDRKAVLALKNDKYSFKDYTNQSLLDAVDISGAVIIGSCFSQSVGLKDKVPILVFPKDMRLVLFVECNLDNVEMPPGNMVADSCSMNLIQPQNDGLDWLLDKNKKPKELRGRRRLYSRGHNINPDRITKKVPSEKEFFDLRRRAKTYIMDNINER